VDSRKPLLLLSALALLTACGSGALRPFPLSEPLWRDPDQHPFTQQPAEYYSPFAWDAANQTLFRPISRFFAVDPAGEAVNVNALDEVPDSSWFENRLGRRGMTPDEMAQGPCTTAPPDPKGPWVITGAKPNGFNPGFFIRTPDGRRYLAKFDGTLEGPRPTTADIVSPRLVHAAGYFAPCNRLVRLDRSILRIDPKAKSESKSGDKVPMTEKDIDTVLSKAMRFPDGRYRASVSLFIEGKPLGPWTYEGTRDDDPNDVVNHEDRRELRGLEVMAAWLGWTDTREQNTMGSFIPVGNGGYVRHYLLDVGNCFGSIWDPPMLGRRIGHAYYLDFPYLAEDLVTLGAIRRPWDEVRFGSTGKVFGYYDVEHFDPDAFRTGYPNPAFVRKSERDAAWMARIIARFDEAHLKRVLKEADLTPELAARLLGVLVGRREKVLRRYLTRLSPLAWPEVLPAGPSAHLCLEDMALTAGIVSPRARGYATRAWATTELDPIPVGTGHAERGRYVCLHLPKVSGASKASPKYLIVDVTAKTASTSTQPVRVHLYHLGGRDYRVVGLERPYSDAPPGGAG
jgi:hypothetical protein